MLVIPNAQSAPAFNGQAIADSTDWAAVTAAHAGTGVVSGGTVTQDTGADMKVAVAAATILVAGVMYQPAATGGSPLVVGGASAGGDRRDIVVYTVGTGYQVIAGTAAGVGNYPVKPAIPANSCLLGEVYVAESTTAITTASNIIDKTTPLEHGLVIAANLGADITIAATTVQTLLSLTLPVAGQWNLDLQAQMKFLNATAGNIDFFLPTASAGTSTYTPAGPQVAEALQPSAGLADNVMCSLHTTLNVTVAGTVVLQYQSSNNALGTIKALSTGASALPVTGARATLVG